ncbi:MAG TPA: hypothetical protein VHS74_17370 [Solirubrobacterales bacterium]|jgi:hypothetical protein|nr:hypothetical protein [Solirubrobacterales bacterium]
MPQMISASRTRRSVGVVRSGLVLAAAASVVVFAVLFCGGAGAAQVGSRELRSEHWRTVDQVGGVGRMESACVGGRPRVRYKATSGTTERVAVKIGPGVTANARLQSGNALELPLGGAAQNWRVEKVSENLPPLILFSVKRRGQGCAVPSVTHRARANATRRRVPAA